MKKKHEDQPGESFRKTIENSEAADALIDAGDMAIAELTDLAGEVPILKWMLAAGKTISSVRDWLLLKKIAAFLADLSSLKIEERRALISRLDAEPLFANRAAEALLTLLDRVDSQVKAVWVSRGLRAYAARAIGAEDLMRLNWVIDRLLISDANEIKNAYLGPVTNMGRLWGQSPFALAALSVGLAKFDAQWEQGMIRPTELCELFVRHILTDDRTAD